MERRKRRVLRATQDAWLKETGDPRVKGETDVFEKYQYFGREPKN